MHIWTLVNQKGGVGKTTSAVSLAGALALQHLNILLVDTDPQASLSHYFKLPESEYSLYDVFLASSSRIKLNDLIVSTGYEGIDILPANSALATLDRQFAQQSGKGLVLKKALSAVKQSYDIVLIDCPPVMGLCMVNALVAGDLIVLPTQTEYLAMKGLETMLSSLHILKGSMQAQHQITIVATMFDKRLNACQNAYKTLREEHNAHLWRGYIPLDTKFRQASEMGIPISALAPQSRGAYAYEKLANDLLKIQAINGKGK